VQRHRELLALLLPALRADFELCETYQYQHEHPLNCPIMMLGGVLDPKVGREELEPWQA
jgi:medium-chain acyl-[acyl-carrier-protein] hydrolase